jgi:hypothetical protein
MNPVKLEAWLAAHRYLRPLADFTARVEDAVAGIQTAARTLADPPRSTQASAAMAYKKVAVNTPTACHMKGSREIHSTRRGE